MHELARQVRFSINPFLPETEVGFNSYASKPCGEGYCLYFALWVKLAGELDEKTGFVVNVVDIDKVVRRSAVPVFSECFKNKYANCRNVTLKDIQEILRGVWGVIEKEFSFAKLMELAVELNPFRKLSINAEDFTLARISEKFEFAAMHKLWNESLSDEKNFEAFGKCANPSGHGHNYVVEVTVCRDEKDEGFRIGEFEKTVSQEFIELVDHKNLNVDVAEFSDKNPTIENVAVLAWEKLCGKFSHSVLESVTVWESDRTYCTYCGSRKDEYPIANKE